MEQEHFGIFDNIAELFLQSVEKHPDKTAVVCGEERLSYREFNRRVNCIANALLDRGIGPGHKVGIMFPNGWELMAVYYALQKIGAVAVPLNFRLIAREIAFLVTASDCRALVFAEKFGAMVAEAKQNGSLPKIKHLVVAGEKGVFDHTLAELLTASNQEPSLFRAPEAVSRIQFTGGSTGVPKGVMRTHRADTAEVLGVMLSNNIGFTPDNVVLIQCPLDHHGGHSWYTSALAAGSTLIICDEFSPHKLLGLLERERVTYMLLLPPSTYLRLLDEPDIGRYDLSSVRLVQSAAGCSSPEIVRRIYEAFPNCFMNYGWGQTESGLGTSLVLSREMAEENHPRLASVGRPMPFCRMKVVDDNGDEVPPGEIGEAVVRGPALMAGYYNQQELTEQTFTKDGWMRTGDLMVQDSEGYLYIKSRKKDMIKSGGENVYAQEVEQVIREHKAVMECIVFGVPDRTMGEAVMAVIQLRRGYSMTLEELQDHCKKRISSYKKPRYLDFSDHFDMNSAGKIRKEETAEQFRQKLRRKKREERGLPPLPEAQATSCMQ